MTGGRRGTPDVSALSGGNAHYAVLNGEHVSDPHQPLLRANGGTSASSPLWASLTTQFNGFGGVINGQPEIFTGTSGFANLRVGDRVDVRGMGRSNNIIAADVITLLGRTVAASQTGVGQTRPSGSATTPGATSRSSTRIGSIDGTVQQIDAADGRIVIVTDRREVLNVRTSSATPVYFQNQTYRVENLEIGDRVRVNPDSSPAPGGEIRAASIEVTRSVQNAVQSGYIRANLGDRDGARTCFAKALALLGDGTAAPEVVATLRDYVQKIDRGEPLPTPLGEMARPEK